MAGNDEKIILLDAVTAHLAEGYAEALGRDPRRFCQNLDEIALAKREAAKLRNRRLLTKQFLDLCAGVDHRRIARRAGLKSAILALAGIPSRLVIVMWSVVEVLSARKRQRGEQPTWESPPLGCTIDILLVCAILTTNMTITSPKRPPEPNGIKCRDDAARLDDARTLL